MSRPFGTTPHSEIAHAFEAENRVHTFVEQLEDGGYTKKYQLRLTLGELLTLLDTLCWVDNAAGSSFRLKVRQLRVKLLQTLGLTEEG